jgi:hypothetical protein
LVYRGLLWQEVERVLDRDGKNEADLARAWKKPTGKSASKSTVKRLREGELPTTLENLDGIAAALGMELGDLVWPLIHPVDPETAERRAATQTRRAQLAFYKRLIDRHMAALEKEDAERLLALVGLLGTTAPDEVETAIDFVEFLVQRRAGHRIEVHGQSADRADKRGGKAS